MSSIKMSPSQSFLNTTLWYLQWEYGTGNAGTELLYITHIIQYIQTEIIMAKVTSEHCLHEYVSLEKLRWNCLHPSGFFPGSEWAFEGWPCTTVSLISLAVCLSYLIWQKLLHFTVISDHLRNKNVYYALVNEPPINKTDYIIFIYSFLTILGLSKTSLGGR